jgi:hypothetical protein
MSPPGNLPGGGNSRVNVLLPRVVREDGYEWPNLPMSKLKWKWRY